jgi:hypothetical protein
MFKKAKQKLLDNWIEDPWERKKQIKKIYKILCRESDAEVLQLKDLGMSAEEIHKYAMKMSAVNIGELLEIIKREKRNKDISAFENSIIGRWPLQG